MYVCAEARTSWRVRRSRREIFSRFEGKSRSGVTKEESERNKVAKIQWYIVKKANLDAEGALPCSKGIGQNFCSTTEGQHL